MPRQAHPWWWEQKNCWATNLGGKRHRELTGIGHNEKPQRAGVPLRVWAWFDALVAENEVKPVRVSDLTIARLCNMYLAWARNEVAEGRLKQGTYSGYKTKIGRFTRLAGEDGRTLGDKPAAEVTAADLQRAVKAWQEAKFKPWYVKGLLRAIQGAYSWAARPVPGRNPERLLESDPFAGYRAPNVPRSPERYAERLEAGIFLRFWLRAFAAKHEPGSIGRKFERNTVLLERVLINTGCRPGEACVLKWHHIQWEGGRNTLGQPFAKGVIPYDEWKAGKKTGKPRTIYFTPCLTRAIRRLHESPGRHPTHVFVHAVGIRTGRHRGRLADFGDPWNSEALAAKVKKIREAAIEEGKRLKKEGKPTGGLDQFHATGPNKITNYRWRHTAISNLLMNGVDIATTAELTGTSAEMIRKSYGHLLDGHLALAAEKIGGARRVKRQP